MAGLELIAKFSADTTGLEKGVGKAKKGVDSLTAAQKKAAARSAQSSKALKQFAVIAVGTAVAVGVKAVKAFAKFEKGMAEVGTLTKFTSKEMHGMSQETLKMSAKFGQSIEVMTKARYDIVSAGFKDITQQTQLLTSANQLAIAGVTDVSTATDALTTVLNAYGEGAGGAAKASDILFATVQAGKTTLPELAASIGKVLPTAKAAGVSFEEVGAAIATMTAAGIQTPQAITALNAAIFTLAAPTKEAAKEMEAMGIQTTDAAGAMLPMVDVLGEFEGMSLEEIRKIIPDKEAAKAILAAANNMDTLRANTVAMIEAAGSVPEAYDAMAKTTAQKLNKINSGWEVLKTTFGGFLMDSRSGLDVFGAVTGGLTKWTQLLTLDAQGVSGLRKEWNMLWEGSPQSRLKEEQALTQNLLNQEKKLKDNIEKIDDKHLEALIANRLQFGEKVVSENEKVQKRINEITLGLQKEGAKKEIETIQSIGTALVSAFTESSEEAGGAVDRNFTAAGAQVASGFSSAASSLTSAMSSSTGESSGIFDGFIGDISGEIVDVGTNMQTSTAAAQYSSFLNNLVRTVTVRVNVQGGGGATGGYVTSAGIVGLAAGGLAPSDTVPAMLTPGEMVINRKQTQKNFGLLSAINSGSGGFARGGMVQGFAGGGAVSSIGAGAQTESSGLGVAFGSFAFEQQQEANEARMEAQLESNEAFLDMMDEYQQGVTDIQLAKMDERDQLFFERQQALSDILQGPYSEEQKELMVENATAFYDAQLGVMEEKQAGEILERQKELEQERLDNALKTQEKIGQATGAFFASQISSQRSFDKGMEALFKQSGSMMIDAIVDEAIKKTEAKATAEAAIAAIEAPNTFGASLLKIAPIMAAGAAAKAALGAIKFHEGGIVGGSIDAPPRDVPIMAQAGERVLSRDETQAMAGGAGGPIIINATLEMDGDVFARKVIEVDPRSGNI